MANILTIQLAAATYKNELAAAKKRINEARLAWSEECLKLLPQVVTVTDAAALFRACPWGTLAKWQTLARWVELCSTAAEIRQALNMSIKLWPVFDSCCPEGWDDLEESPMGVKYRTLCNPKEKVERCGHYTYWPKSVPAYLKRE